MSFEVVEEVAFFDLDDRRSWQEGGSWPHSNHCGFYEAVAAAHFVLQGYQAIRYGSATKADDSDPLTSAHTRLLHEVVGPEVSAFFLGELAAATNGGSGQPDLFVFREPETPRDPKVHFVDPRLWFFVEVKGPRDRVQDTQRTFWRQVASKLGKDRIRLFRTLPRGDCFEPETVHY